MKVIKIVVTCLVLLSTFALGGCSQQSQDNKYASYTSDEAKDKVREVLNNATFSEEEAKNKIQEYIILVDLPDVTKGTSIGAYYDERGKIPAITNLGWFSEETNESEKYTVGYKQQVGELISSPRWEVTETSIRAINGAAIKITPELGPQPK